MGVLVLVGDLCAEGEEAISAGRISSFMRVKLEVTEWETCALKEAIGQRRFQGSSTFRLEFGPASRGEPLQLEASTVTPLLSSPCLHIVSGIA